MATDQSPQVIMVPVKRYDVNLTLDDILTPLTQTSGHVARAPLGKTLDPEVAQLLRKFTDLVTQLKDVVNQINKIDPSLLAPKAGPPPGA
jgi:hypothetical protein